MLILIVETSFLYVGISRQRIVRKSVVRENMQIWELIQTLIGTVVGGFIVIAANWLTGREERKKAAQEWYEQTYLTNGIDPLLVYIHSLELHLLNGWVGHNYMQLPELGKIPIEALTKIEILLSDGTLSNIIGMVHVCFNDRDGYSNNAAHNGITATYRLLLEVRRELLTIIGSKVRNKNYHMDVKQHKIKLSKIFETLNHDVQETIQERKNSSKNKVES